MKKSILAFFLLAGFSAYAQDKIKQQDMAFLKSLMTGTFTSAEQAKKDTNFFDISLQMVEVGSDERNFWLYVEQAVSTAKDRPYRQRLYRVYQVDDTTVASVIYEFKEPKQFVGAWTKDDSKKQLKDFIQLISTDQDTPNLIFRQGCTMYLKKKGKTFEGSTKGNSCVSNLRGAAYATSTAVITEKGMVTLDRGYDASGKQVWGSEFGGYQFIRQ